MRLRGWSGKALRTGNDSGVTRVVLGDALLDLADEVRTDVGGLRRQRAHRARMHVCLAEAAQHRTQINWQRAPW